ncbi:MAG: CDP-alcohol phosphatidyltransferase family protein [Candidatus Nanopelagicales bacterium]|jgi:cardiolipin synthase|nr:CDP-alcohol phosphatidyltransferase family protein [Candidatus Nanopelagicales bacterium]
MRVQEPVVRTDLVWTLPNVLSGIRLLTIPLFAWLALVPQQDALAALVLALGGATDFFDGVLARRWNQVTRLGQLLDPIADRLSTVTVLVVFLIRGVVPLWFVALLVLRDVVLAVEMGRLKSRGITGLPVNFIGKAATFNLMISFPLLLWGADPQTIVEELARIAGWAFAWWGTGLYLYSAALYIRQTREVIADLPAPAGA